MKEAWDEIYGNNQMSAQTLRDNAVRFRKDKLLLNLIDVRDGEDIDPEVVEPRHIEPNRGEENTNMIENAEVDGNVGEGENNEENLENKNEEDENTRILRMRFEDVLATLTPTTKENIADRERLVKLNKGVSKNEVDIANKVLERHLNNNDDICKAVDAVYAMAKTIEERSGVERTRRRKQRRILRTKKNRRIRKSEKKIKELRQIIAWTANEIHRRKIKRKATTNEKEILRKLKDMEDQQLLRKEELIYLKEKMLDELRYQRTKLKHVKTRDARIRNNRMFQEDQDMFYRKTQGRKQTKSKVPEIEKFKVFWAGI